MFSMKLFSFFLYKQDFDMLVFISKLKTYKRRYLMQKYFKSVLLSMMLVLLASSLSFASVEGSTATAMPDSYTAGAIQTIEFLVWNGSMDAEWLDEIIITLPEGWVITEIWHRAGPNNYGSHLWFMQGQGTNTARWFNNQGFGVHYSQSDRYYGMKVWVPPTAGNVSMVDVWVRGDGWGMPPHDISIPVELYTSEEATIISPFEVHKSVGAGSTFTQMFDYWNNTGHELEVDLSYVAEPGYSVNIFPENFTSGSGDHTNFFVTVTTPAGKAPKAADVIEITAAGYMAATKSYTASASRIKSATPYYAHVYIYVSLMDNFTAGFAAPTQDNRLDAAVVAVHDRIYAIGGYNSATGPVSTVEIYDPVTESWQYGPSLPLGITVDSSSSAAVVEDKIVVQNGTSNKWLYLCTTSNMWHTITAPFDQSYGGKIVAHNNMIYLTGGASIDSQVHVSDKMYQYNIITDSWKAMPSIPAGVWWHQSFVADDVLYVAGGYQGQGTHYSLSADTWAFDFEGQRWYQVESMPEPRWGAAGTYNGEYFVLAGGNDGISATDSIFIYDPSANIWETAKATLPIPTFRFGAAAIGKDIFTVGGWERGSNHNGLSHVQHLESVK